MHFKSITPNGRSGKKTTFLWFHLFDILEKAQLKGIWMGTRGLNTKGMRALSGIIKYSIYWLRTPYKFGTYNTKYQGIKKHEGVRDFNF